MPGTQEMEEDSELLSQQDHYCDLMPKEEQMRRRDISEEMAKSSHTFWSLMGSRSF